MKTDRAIINQVAKYRDPEKYSFIVEYTPPLVRSQISGNDILMGRIGILKRSSIEIYIHIPDCPYICDFCSFFKLPKLTDKERDRYINAVQKELDIYLEKSDLRFRKVNSLFFGGGTPTTLTTNQFSRLINYLREKLNFDTGIEITVESTPDTLNDEILQVMKNSGVNRLSIGVQDFNDDVLKARNRLHTGEEAINSFKRARQYGFDKINIDLIYRLPKQSLQTWKKNLDIIKELKPDYVTLYHLRKEQRSALGKKPEVEFPSKETAMEMYIMTLEFLVDLGYMQIAPNQFALPNKRFKQQEAKWHHGSELLGLGISAYSSFNGHAYRNIGRFGHGMKNAFEEYMQRLESGHLAIESGEKLSQIEQMRKFAVFGIKTSGINRADGGINKKLFHERFGIPINNVLGEVLWDLKNEGLIEETDDYIRLPIAGLIVAEEVAGRFYSEDVKEKLRKTGEIFGRQGL